MSTKKELTKEQVIRALRRLENGWPDDLELFAASGTLCLMQKGPDGAVPTTARGGYDPDAVIEGFPGIGCDGGDW